MLFGNKPDIYLQRSRKKTALFLLQECILHSKIKRFSLLKIITNFSFYLFKIIDIFSGTSAIDCYSKNTEVG